VTPYFEQDGVTVYHGACVDVLADMAARSVGLFVTDPPYSGQVHANMRSNKGRKIGTGTSVNNIDFAEFTHDDMAAAFAAMGRVVSRWVLATTAFEHAGKLCDEPPPGLRFIRCGSWTKIAPTPQMIGDRPAQGWEAVAILHAADGEKMRWNGGGRPAVWHHRAEMNGVYPTQKPEPLIMDFLSDFGEPGDLVCDPFCGSGTTLLCAWKRGHKAIGCDIREAACEIAAKRIEAEMRQGRMPIALVPTRADQARLAF
jgi:site-specific DNA-methyltransferase (adenine-specific)